MNNQQFNVLWEHAVATGDVDLVALLNNQIYNPKSWDEFLVGVILAQAQINKDLRDRLVDVMSNRPPAPIIIDGTQYTFVSGDNWAQDYPACYYNPDGSWKLDS